MIFLNVQSLGCISVNIDNAMSHRTPFSAKTVPLLLWSFEKNLILELNVHMHYNFYQSSKLGLCGIFSTIILPVVLSNRTLLPNPLLEYMFDWLTGLPVVWGGVWKPYQ